MTVATDTSRVAYSGSGSTGPFTIPFYFLDNSHIRAVKLASGTETVLTITTHYTLTGAGDEDGGTLTLVTALASGETLTIIRDVPVTQATQWPRSDPFPAQSHERAADKLTMIAQQHEEKLDRTLKLPETETGTAAKTTLPSSTSRASKFLAFDASGNPVAAEGSDGTTGSLAVALAASSGASLVGVIQSGSGAVAGNVQDELRRWVRPEHYEAAADGTTNDRAAIAAADTFATSSGTILFQAGKTYLCSTSLTIAANCYFEPGANISVPSGQTITFSGRVIALDGNPTTGDGSATYSHDGNLFINASGNSGGFSFGITPCSGTDDFFRIQRDVDTSVGLLIRNDSTGSSAEGFIHLWGGPLSGSTGSGLRMSANSAAGGSLVDIVAHDNLAFSIIQQSNANIDFYANNLKSFQIKPSGGTTVNFPTVKGGAAGSAVQYEVDGTDADISVIYNLKGAGSHFFRTAGSTVYQFEIYHTASATNRVRVTGSNGGNPTIATSGGNLAITPAVIVAATTGSAIGTTTSASTVLNLPAGTTAASSIRLAHGSAPTSPVNGDMWTTTAGLFVQVNGSTVGPLTA